MGCLGVPFGRLLDPLELLLIDLCASCGMCCTGTLFNYVTLVDDDLPKLKKYPALRLKHRDGQDTFDEPCVLHTGTGCSAYEDRPGTCSRYDCHVVLGVRRETMTELEGLRLIQQGRALVDEVKRLVDFPPGEPLAISKWESPPKGLSPAGLKSWERTKAHLQRHFLGAVPASAAALTVPLSPKPSGPVVTRPV